MCLGKLVFSSLWSGKKKNKSERSLIALQDISKGTNFQLTGIPDGEEKGGEKIYLSTNG
jgi:hypothetical protein